MAGAFHLRVATPEKLLVDEQVTEAELPGENGYMGILAGHASLLSALRAGVVTFQSQGGKSALAIAGGFVEVFEDNVCVLADHAVFPQDIDTAKARRDLEEAHQALRRADSESAATAATQAAERAQAMLDAASPQR